MVAVLAGVLLLPGGEAPRERVATPARVAIEAPPQPRQPRAEPSSGPSLQGVPPTFAVGKGVGVAENEAGKAGDSATASSSEAGGDTEASDDTEATADDESGAVVSSVKKPVPAGPAAMKVARRFSEAFIFYEIGQRRDRAQTVFEETATPELAEALSERPPRQPQGGKVPKARVVNLVPGPRAGKAYTVSVSMLRVGLTTELRLQMRKNKSRWLVTDVRG